MQCYCHVCMSIWLCHCCECMSISMSVLLSLAGQTLIIGAKESGETHAKVMFHWNV